MNWREALASLGMLGLAWLAWEAAGWLVAQFGLPVAALLQQVGLLVLFLGLVERLAPAILPPILQGDRRD
jgi:hypothetical protein